MKNQCLTFLILVFSLFSQVVNSDQTRLDEYSKAEPLFWGVVYPYGGWTLYCDKSFEDEKGLSTEHIYPASKMAKQLGCDSVNQCRENSARFNNMEADLHNLFPALIDMESARSNHEYGVIDGEQWLNGYCDFEINDKAKIIEPSDKARGDIARAYFYMMDEYMLPVDSSELSVLKEWNRQDPPSRVEKWRNIVIGNLQGTKNSYIDDPSKADHL